MHTTNLIRLHSAEYPVPHEQCISLATRHAEAKQSQASTNGTADPPSTAAAFSGADSNGNAEATAQVTGIPLRVPFQLRSADSLQTPFTNYVRGYAGLLDYVWFEPHRLKVDRRILLPSLQEVQGYLPSERFPSDHLSVRSLNCCTWHDAVCRKEGRTCRSETRQCLW